MGCCVCGRGVHGTGCCVCGRGACVAGGHACGEGEMATSADGTHHTGMHKDNTRLEGIYARHDGIIFYKSQLSDCLEGQKVFKLHNQSSIKQLNPIEIIM